MENMRPTNSRALSLEQNELIKNGKHGIKEATELNMATVGIINGVTDMEAMALGWLDYARNNTYDYPIINETSYVRLMDLMTDRQRGCFARLHSCRAAQAQNDPQMRGIDTRVNKACAAASVTCLEIGFTGVDNATIVSSNTQPLLNIQAESV